MASITSWMRLEPTVRDAEMASSLQAKVYDPLWLLARQWQLGEFKGEDNGTPVSARLRGEAPLITRYHQGALPDRLSEGQRYDSKALPLEALAEQERVHSPAGKAERLLLAAEAGLHFLRLLKQRPPTKNYQPSYVQKYPFPRPTPEQLRTMDDASRRFLEIVSSRVPDGVQLFQELSNALRQGALPAEPAIEPSDAQLVKDTAEAWLNWYRGLFREPVEENSAWLPERMEYSFSVAGRLPSIGESVLTAREYYDGDLDWYAFNINPGASLGAASDTPATTFVQTMIPAPVSYRGMPAQRWWEFEDAAVNFGAIEAGPVDLAKMLLIEFAVSYGNDWFVVPLELPVGSLSKIHSLVVADTFGVRTVIKSAADLGEPHASWRMFRLSNERGTSPVTNLRPPDLFFLAPTLIRVIEGQPVEEVLFLRDEMANLAWGVERVVESLTGRPLNRPEHFSAEQHRREREREPSTPGTETPKADALVYRLASSVPDYWIPLVPKQIVQGQPDIRFVRGAMLSQEGTREIALSRILTPEANRQLAIYEEEIPPERVRVTRSYQLARWLDGSTHLWIGRRKAVGGSEGSSGMRFDIAHRRGE
jgi:hypothetical protein